MRIVHLPVKATVLGPLRSVYRVAICTGTAAQSAVHTDEQVNDTLRLLAERFASVKWDGLHASAAFLAESGDDETAARLGQEAGGCGPHLSGSNVVRSRRNLDSQSDWHFRIPPEGSADMSRDVPPPHTRVRRPP